MSIKQRFKKAFRTLNSNNKDPTPEMINAGFTYYSNPVTPRFDRSAYKSFITSIYTRIAMDVAQLEFKHVKTNDDGVYVSTVKSYLNEILTVEANVDQTHRDFMRDVVISLLDEGVVALFPTVTDNNVFEHNNGTIYEMRTAKIKEWFPRYIRIEAYNDETGLIQEITVPKENVAIIENPLYTIMNDTNSTIKQLSKKLALLDLLDENTAHGKLDLIIQMPFSTQALVKRDQAKKRIAEINEQMKSSNYGLAYIDSQEKLIQLNRPMENNLFKQVEYLTNMLYKQLGISESVLDGTADEAIMQNYYTRIIEPIASAIVEEMKRKFLSITARTQGQSIMYFRDPFKLMPVKDLADTGDKMIRNTIMSSNEMRSKIGLKPSSDPEADKLKNPNISESKEQSQENPKMGKESMQQLTKKPKKQIKGGVNNEI